MNTVHYWGYWPLYGNFLGKKKKKGGKKCKILKFDQHNRGVGRL